MNIYEETSWIRKLKPGITGTYGIEIETETFDPYPLECQGPDVDDTIYNFQGTNELKFWKITEDHSLRNYGYEYILTKPLVFEDVKLALEEFSTKTDKLGIKFIDDKQSTSVHVHVNMRTETFLTLGNFVTLFTLFEGPLIDFCGERRRSNFFCISNRHAEGLCRRMTSFFKDVYDGKADALHNLSEEDQKYASLNLVPLHKLGSIEVRTMRGCTDTETIYRWVGMLNKILSFSQQNITPLDIIAGWRQGEMEFFDAVFGGYSQFLRSPSTRESVERSLWYAGSIAASCPDWNKIVGKMKEAGQALAEKKVAMKMNAKALVNDNAFVGNMIAPGMIPKAVNWVVMDEMPALDEEIQF